MGGLRGEWKPDQSGQHGSGKPMPRQELLANHAGTASQVLLAGCGVGQRIQMLAERFSC